jgi:hypothetical protein
MEPDKSTADPPQTHRGRARKALPIFVLPKPQCPFCGSTSIKRYDSRRDSFGELNLSMECHECARRWKFIDEHSDEYEPEITSRDLREGNEGHLSEFTQQENDT